jgi:4-alpha-glucanotransferase
MKNRGSGILLHLTSLPSPYGIGDLGPWAYRFADFLAQGKQSYWQVLPLTPTDPFSGNSPYSSPSAFAGNILLISPELLEESGFLTKEDREAHPSFPEARCDYGSVTLYKEQLFQRAYERFRSTGHEKERYEEFCKKNKAWLEHFALFVVIKKNRNGKAWGEWEKDLRDKNPKEIDRVKRAFDDELEREKFLQYLFFKQWFSLKKYCNGKGFSSSAISRSMSIMTALTSGPIRTSSNWIRTRNQPLWPVCPLTISAKQVNSGEIRSIDGTCLRTRGIGGGSSGSATISIFLITCGWIISEALLASGKCLQRRGLRFTENG